MLTAELAAVEELKARLPAINKEALDTEEPYVLWNVPLDSESTDGRLNVLLVKFLRARNLNVENAATMLTNTLKWRKEFKTDDILEETFDQEVYGSIGYLHKHDREGRPVCYNLYGDLDQDKVFGQPETFIRWRVQLMEKGVRSIDLVNVDSMLQVHDYKGASMFGRTSNAKAATKEIIAIMQDNYPEYLSTKFFVNVPWWGSTIFQIVRPFLPEATVKKFVVCSSGEIFTGLTALIDSENLPDQYQPVVATKEVKSPAKEENVEANQEGSGDKTEVLTSDLPESEPDIETLPTDEPEEPLPSRKEEKKPANTQA
ncbi:CRAL-TRIO domain-containing protein [Phycomyces nitens]|nr:CRAL-TRIO domain-containing protein [Phycomyces nitens]